MDKKSILALAVIGISVILVLVLYAFPTLLIIFLLLLAYTKNHFSPIKKEFVLFFLIVISSAVVEIILVNMTHSWSYTNSQLFGIPFWPPIFWGLLGTSLITFYEGISKN
jgi:glucan phosphoethanolaminetransferase (alkaline phosphatase superfamily)